MLKILWVSDSPIASSGYSVQSRITAPRLAALGHEVALLATYGLHGGSIDWNGLRLYPGGADPFANDVIAMTARDWRADIVITLKDTFVFNPSWANQVRWCPMTPVDHDPLAPGIIERLRYAYRPIAYAPHGFRALRAAGFDPLYCPHAYDPAIFNPQDKQEARRFLGLPDDLFIVGTVAVNRGGIPSRKAWTQNLKAFSLFARDKPNVRYFLHTNICEDGFEGGINLRYFASRYGVLDKALFCDQEKYKNGFPDNYLHAFYNAIDVLNAVSLGEGFGIPALEAQACSTPVIVGDWCAHEDLCFAGWKVRKDEALEFPDNQLTDVYIPQPAAIADRMEQAYGLHEQGWGIRKLQQQATLGATPYQIDRVVADHWKPALEEIEEQIRGEHSRGVLRIIRREEVFS